MLYAKFITELLKSVVRLLMSSHLRHEGSSVALSNEILWLLSGNSTEGRHLCEIEKKLFLVLMWLDYPNHPQGWNGSLVHFLTFLFISNRPPQTRAAPKSVAQQRASSWRNL